MKKSQTRNTENQEEEEVFEVTPMSDLRKRVIKWMRLYNYSRSLFYKGEKVVQLNQLKVGKVESMGLDTVKIQFKDGTREDVEFSKVLPEEEFFNIASNITLVVLMYKGVPTPSVLLTEGAYVLPCRKYLDDFRHTLAIPKMRYLKNITKDGYYQKIKMLLKRVSWKDMSVEEIDKLTQTQIDNLLDGTEVEDDVTGLSKRLPPELTLDSVIEQIKEFYKVVPCENCTVPISGDCRFRIARELRPYETTSYKNARKAFQSKAGLMASLIKGPFRGQKRIRFVSPEDWLKEMIVVKDDERWAEFLLKALKQLEEEVDRKFDVTKRIETYLSM